MRGEERNALGEVVQWKVRWFQPKVGYLRNESAPFEMLEGPRFIEVINIEPEFLVARLPKLIYSGKKLSADAIKEAKPALQFACIAEGNGEVTCNGCQEDKADEELVACCLCSRCYHKECAPGLAECPPNKEWWCPDCVEEAPEED